MGDTATTTPSRSLISAHPKDGIITTNSTTIAINNPSGNKSLIHHE